MIIGHKKQLNFLKKIAEGGKIPHALLFSGQEKLGKKTVALKFLSLLLGQNPKNHPDFILIEPKEKQIQIDQIRELSWRLSLKPAVAPLIGTIVDESHLMTKEAQNCFLKTLEEPKSQSLLILITNNQNLLLPTIISRCQIIKFFPVENQEIINFLREKGVLKEKIEEIVKISQGKVGLAIDFLENPRKLKERESRVKELIKITSPNSSIASRFRYIKDISQKENIDIKEVLNIWLSYFREALIAAQKDKIVLARVKKALDSIQNTIFLISTTNINLRLALEVLMMNL